METFVIGDTHFDHADIILHSKLPWCKPNPRHDPSLPFDFKRNNPLMVTPDCLAAYGQSLVDNWNSIVGKRDRVIINGDFAFANHAKWACRLRGHKILIVGNHDEMSQDALKSFVEVHQFGVQKSICTGKLYPDGKGVKDDVTFCHYAMRSWPNSCYGSAHIYAHDHGRMPELDNLIAFTCSTNVWGFIPTPWEAIQRRIDAKRRIVQARNVTDGGESFPKCSYSSDPEKRIEATRKRNLAVLKEIGINIPSNSTNSVPASGKAGEKHEPKKSDGMVSAVIAVADKPTVNGRVYTRDALKRLADGNTFIWIEKAGKLVMRTNRHIITDKDKASMMIRERLDVVGRGEASEPDGTESQGGIVA